MKFVDEAKIEVIAGKGGDGCLSFRREKFIPFGGPNGGDGGDGGNIYLIADTGLNTLADFRYKRLFKAQKGEHGKGSDCSGKKGDDLYIKVPTGTIVRDAETNEIIADMKQPGQQQLVAKGGIKGLGNARFKSSTNQAPRKTTKGTPGEARHLFLELQVLADVGLLGYPNAGKSTFISSVSAAKPKIADYPFTTLHPNLGVVSLAPGVSFVVADIPGLIEGAAAGAGLGIRFLKHLSRTRLLLHIIDIAPVGKTEADIAKEAQALVAELAEYDTELEQRPRWLVINKADLIDEQELNRRKQQVITSLNWQGPVFVISAVTKHGTDNLCSKIAEYFANLQLA